MPTAELFIIALATPLLLGAVAALAVLEAPSWIGDQGRPW